MEQRPEEFAWLISKIDGFRSVLEIGSRAGASLNGFSHHIGQGGKLRSIDYGWAVPNYPDVETGKELQQAVDKLCAEGFDAKCLISDSHKAEARAWAAAEGPYDLVFIDGDHEYDGVKLDWEWYGPLGKWVALHDINHDTHGVGKLWEQIKRYHRTDECIVGNDCGVGLVYRW